MLPHSPLLPHLRVVKVQRLERVGIFSFRLGHEQIDMSGIELVRNHKSSFGMFWIVLVCLDQADLQESFLRHSTNVLSQFLRAPPIHPLPTDFADADWDLIKTTIPQRFKAALDHADMAVLSKHPNAETQRKSMLLVAGSEDDEDVCLEYQG